MFGDMTALGRRLLRGFLALIFVMSVTVQLVPVGTAHPDIRVSADMLGGCDGPKPPCSGHLPNCVDHAGCITVSALPTSLVSIAVPVVWTLLDYDLVPESLAGISLKPELSPPILAA
jgi:hypothetical protein